MNDSAPCVCDEAPPPISREHDSSACVAPRAAGDPACAAGRGSQGAGGVSVPAGGEAGCGRAWGTSVPLGAGNLGARGARRQAGQREGSQGAAGQGQPPGVTPGKPWSTVKHHPPPVELK